MTVRVLHVASEVFPFSRSGGLADVLGALPQAQGEQGLEVTVLSPWYRDLAGTPNLVLERGEVHLGELRQGGVRYLFLGLPEFDRPGLYAPDDVWRFAKLCRLALPALDALGVFFDVLHAHDWGAGPLCYWARERALPSLFTVHNLQYQGRWRGAEALPWTGLPDSTFTPQGVEFHGDLNMLKAGLVYADAVSTVSPTYAREITTPQYGEGLEGVLRARMARGELHGILNGLDTARWDPRADPLILPYGDPAGKAANKEALRAELGLRGLPVLAAVTRLVEQKGIDLLLEALPSVTRDWDVAVLGSGDPRLEAALQTWDGRGLRYFQGLDEALAHRLYAGADAYVMPSRFEPCGLSQMIALRYGTPPVVRDTGGLHDSVPRDAGFLFGVPSARALMGALRAARAALGDSAAWEARVRRGMALDFSWAASARQYSALYERVGA